MTFLIAVLSSFASKLAANEAQGWIPRLAERVLIRAVQKLPDEHRERYAEEWRAHMRELPGCLAGLAFAIGLLSAASRIANLQAGRPPKFLLAYKRSFDITFASFAIVVSAPAFLLALALVKLLIRRAALAKLPRVGRNGHVFHCLRFRTHDEGADENSSKFGSLLRRYALHVLPEFFNVLKGQMSIIGPTPTLPWELDASADADRPPWLAAKPGVVSPWVMAIDSLDNVPRLSYGDIREMDIQYVSNMSLWVDSRIFLHAVWLSALAVAADAISALTPRRRTA